MSLNDWFDQRAADALFADHEDGHPDGLNSPGCRYCSAEGSPETFSSDNSIPQYDVPERLTRELP